MNKRIAVGTIVTFVLLVMAASAQASLPDTFGIALNNPNNLNLGLGSGAEVLCTNWQNTSTQQGGGGGVNWTDGSQSVTIYNQSELSGGSSFYNATNPSAGTAILQGVGKQHYYAQNEKIAGLDTLGWTSVDIYVYGHNGSAQIVSDNPGLGYPGGGVVTNGAQQSMSLNSGLTTYVDGSGGTGNYLKFSDIAVLSNLWVNMTESDWSALQVVKHSGAPPTPANFTATPAGPFDFGPVGVSTISAVQTVTLTNIGGTAGDVTGATVTGGFAFTVPEPGVTPYSVGPAGTAVYGIQLPAQALPGSYAGTATFTTSAGGPFTYDLTATVFAHAGDVNGDGQVSLLDYNIIKANFGNTYESGNHWGDGDVNGDEQVGLLDFNIVKAHFGHTTGDGAAVTAVPEPATLSLLALAGLAALRRKR